MEGNVSICQIDPKIVQGLLTIMAAIIASSTALIVAFVAYPRQKGIDREHELGRERRILYRKFANSFRSFSQDWPGSYKASDYSTSLNNLESCISEIIISSPENVAENVVHLRIGIQNLLAANNDGEDEEVWVLHGALESVFDRCMRAMREDSFKNSKVANEAFSHDTASIMKL